MAGMDKNAQYKAGKMRYQGMAWINMIAKKFNITSRELSKM